MTPANSTIFTQKNGLEMMALKEGRFSPELFIPDSIPASRGGSQGEGRSPEILEPADMWQKQPFQVDLPAGETAAFCMCGQTSTPPMCDGSHKGSDIRPKVVKYDKDKTLWVCGCRESGASPFCDGTHKTL